MIGITCTASPTALIITMHTRSKRIDAGSTNNPGRLVNLSVRNRTTRGVDALIAGFVLQGNSGKSLVVRGIGPALSGFQVEGALTDTLLEVFDKTSTTEPIASNAGWTSASGDGRELGAFSLTPGSADSVVRATFGSEPYTARVRPRTDATADGIALVEIYDAATADVSTRLTNLSARTQLAADSDVTVGFVIAGETPRSVLLRWPTDRSRACRAAKRRGRCSRGFWRASRAGFLPTSRSPRSTWHTSSACSATCAAQRTAAPGWCWSCTISPWR